MNNKKKIIILINQRLSLYVLFLINVAIIPITDVFANTIHKESSYPSINTLSTDDNNALNTSVDNKNKYRGEKLSLNFQDIEVRSVIAVIAEFTKQNIVAGDDITGNITLKLNNVPWDEALDFILMTKDLEKFESGTVILIAPAGKIKEFKAHQQETESAIEQLDPLVTEYIKINYAKAENFRNLLNGLDTGQFGGCGVEKTSSLTIAPIHSNLISSSTLSQETTNSSLNSNNIEHLTNKLSKKDTFKILSTRGTAVVDARTNTLIIRETAIRLDDAKKLIAKLDVPVRQVMIESRIVIASNTFAKQLGVRFGVAGNNFKYGNNSGGVGSVNNQGGTIGSINGTGVVNDALVDLAASNPYGQLGMTLAKGADYVLNLELSALQDQGKGELVSNPRVMTTDRCSAKIKQGTQEPYQSGSTATTPANIQFIDALLELDVIPQITPSGSISMSLSISKNEPNYLLQKLNQPPPLTKREVETTVQVMDGETVVLGGVLESTKLNTINSVPYLSELPFIGSLFKRTINTDDKKELLIFITPKIIKDNAASN